MCVGIIASKNDLYNQLNKIPPAGYIIPLIGYSKLIIYPRSISIYYRISNKNKTYGSIQSLAAGSTLTLDILDNYHSIVITANGSTANWYGMQYELLVNA